MQFQSKLRVPVILNWEFKEELTERGPSEPRPEAGGGSRELWGRRFQAEGTEARRDTGALRGLKEQKENQDSWKGVNEP